VDRCALFVDAGYVLADGAMSVHGTRQRDSVSWDYAGLIKLLTGLSRDRTGLPVLRCYWYEAIVEGQRNSEHDALADLPGLKLRLGRMRPGRREGVEAEMQRDLTMLARNHAVSDAVIVSAEEDLAEVVAEVQDFGMRVTIIHIMADGDWTISKPLRQECDDIIEISAAHLRPFVDLIPGAEPAVHDGQFQNGSYPRQNLANGNGSGLGAMTHQGLPAAALPPGPTIYNAPVVEDYQVEDYQRTADPMPSGPAASPGMPAMPMAPPAAGQDTGPQPDGRRGGRGTRGAGPATGPQPGGRRGAGAHAGGARAAGARGGGPVTGPQSAGMPSGPVTGPHAAGIPAGLSGAPTDPQIMAMPGPPTGPHAVMPGPPTGPHAVMPGPPTGPHAVMPGPPAGPMPGPPSGPHMVRQAGPHAGGPPASGAFPGPYPQGPLPPGPATPAAAGLPALPAGPSSYQGPGPLPGEQAAAGGPGFGPGAPAPDGRNARNPRRSPRTLNAGHQGPPAPQSPPQAPGSQPYPQPSMPQAPMPPSMPQAPGLPMPQAPMPQGAMAQHAMPQPPGPPGPMPPGPPGPMPPGPMPQQGMPQQGMPQQGGPGDAQFGQRPALPGRDRMGMTGPQAVRPPGGAARFAESSAPYAPAPPGQFGSAGPAQGPPQQFHDPQAGPLQGYPPQHEQGPYGGPQGALVPMSQAAPQQSMAVSLADAVQAAHAEGFGFGDAVARDAPALWLEAVLARKPRMPSDLEARLLQGSSLPIDSLLHDEVRHSLRRGFWDALERSRR
jgi:NYN domain